MFHIQAGPIYEKPWQNIMIWTIFRRSKRHQEIHCPTQTPSNTAIRNIAIIAPCRPWKKLPSSMQCSDNPAFFRQGQESSGNVFMGQHGSGKGSVGLTIAAKKLLRCMEWRLKSIYSTPRGHADFGGEVETGALRW